MLVTKVFDHSLLNILMVPYGNYRIFLMTFTWGLLSRQGRLASPSIRPRHLHPPGPAKVGISGRHPLSCIRGTASGRHSHRGSNWVVSKFQKAINAMKNIAFQQFPTETHHFCWILRVPHFETSAAPAEYDWLSKFWDQVVTWSDSIINSWYSDIMWAINNILIHMKGSRDVIGVLWWRVCKLTIFQSSSSGANLPIEFALFQSSWFWIFNFAL